MIRVLGDGVDSLTQLVKGGQVGGESGLGADLLGFGSLGNGPIVDTAGQPMQCGPHGRAEDVGHLDVGQCGQLPHGLDAESMQFLLGNRADSPQPPHRQAVEQPLFFLPADHSNAVRLGQTGRDLGDLLA
ncbi:hypothetical protein NIIDMKKI_40350 [Mycobacterium kansasii]|uniref:Uncharacterized protein n=1 Tax=Mycobacterium kansasii TaxID=1768 RepID=A0A7G1IGP1_MYCKA|nr:hypothetical protein NIIDMKKI_40350 [Mycobacterium kansasii]